MAERLTSLFQLVSETTSIKLKVCKTMPPIMPDQIPCNIVSEFIVKLLFDISKEKEAFFNKLVTVRGNLP